MKRLENAGARVREAFELARVAALKSPSFFRHGATLFRRGCIFGIGHNDYRTVTWAWPNNHVNMSIGEESDIRLNNMHAEISCMHNTSRSKIIGSDIAVVRLHKQGRFANSKPCKNCEKNMRRKGIRRCYYSHNDYFYGILEF